MLKMSKNRALRQPSGFFGEYFTKKRLNSIELMTREAFKSAPTGW